MKIIKLHYIHQTVVLNRIDSYVMSHFTLICDKIISSIPRSSSQFSPVSLRKQIRHPLLKIYFYSGSAISEKNNSRQLHVSFMFSRFVLLMMKFFCKFELISWKTMMLATSCYSRITYGNKCSCYICERKVYLL